MGPNALNSLCSSDKSVLLFSAQLQPSSEERRCKVLHKHHQPEVEAYATQKSLSPNFIDQLLDIRLPGYGSQSQLHYPYPRLEDYCSTV